MWMRSAAGLVLGLAFPGLVSLCACGDTRPSEPRPNVLLITIDTLRADHVGSYGFPHPITPNIDRLAGEGVVFERAVAAATSTAPAHASIMTSRFTRRHSIGYLNGGSRLEDAVTLAERFRAAGFATGAFVGNMVLRRRTGLDAGFGHYDDDLPSAELNRSKVFERTAELTTRRALEWLAAADDPVFLWVHYQDPHGPYAPPPAWSGAVDLAPAPGEEALPVLQNNSGWKGIPAYQVLEGVYLPSEYRRRYAGEIAYVDHWVGELLEAFDRRSAAGPPTVLLTSDHGESFGENDRWFVHAFSAMPELAHVPFMLRSAGLAPGRRRGVASHVDVMPTLLELAGLDPPADPDGIALGPLLRSGEPLPERRVYCDIGVELGAYGRDDLVRALRVDFAWDTPEEMRTSSEGPPAWLRFRWNDDGSFSLARDDDAAKAAIQAYFEAATPMVRAPPRADEEEQLRALGYLDTEAGS